MKNKDERRQVNVKDTLSDANDSIKKTYLNINGVLRSAFEGVSKFADYILLNKHLSKIISVLLAVLFYFYVNGVSGDTVITDSIKQAVVLDNIPVSTNISDSVYEVSGLPSVVSITVSGDNSDVQYAAQHKSDYKVLADLSDLSEGTHEVELQPVNFSSKVDVSIEPSSVTVTISKKISRSFTIQSDFINTDQLDSIYTLGEPELSQSEAIVRASEDTVNQISYVKALIDVSNVDGDFTQEATLVAYNQSGEKLDVDILPSTVTATVKVTTPHKDVPITIVPEGDMQDGVSIESYEVDPDTITIYGAESVLANIDEITVSVPVNKITEDTTVTMPIMLPANISKGSVTKVKIKIKVKNATSKTIDDVPITLKNHDESYNASIDGGDTISVTVSGTSSVVKSISKDNITVVLDLNDYNQEGTFEVPLTVTGTNNLANYTLSKTSVKITVTKKGD